MFFVDNVESCFELLTQDFEKYYNGFNSGGFMQNKKKFVISVIAKTQQGSKQSAQMSWRNHGWLQN
jgi:hypothetical protein